MATFTIHTDEKMADVIRRPLPDFLVINNPLTPEEADELRSVQKEFDVIDEEMWKTAPTSRQRTGTSASSRC